MRARLCLAAAIATAPIATPASAQKRPDPAHPGWEIHTYFADRSVVPAPRRLLGHDAVVTDDLHVSAPPELQVWLHDALAAPRQAFLLDLEVRTLARTRLQGNGTGNAIPATLYTLAAWLAKQQETGPPQSFSTPIAGSERKPVQRWPRALD